MGPEGREGYRSQVRVDEFKDLPTPFQKAVYLAHKQNFRSFGKTDKEASRLAERACEEPSYFQAMALEPSWSWKDGLDFNGLRVAVVAGIVSGFVTVALDWHGNRVELRRALDMGTLGFGGVS